MQALALKCEGNNGGSPSAHFGGTMRHILIRSIVVVLLVTSTRMALAAESGNPAYNWSGFYTGVNVGWNWVRTSNSGTAVTSAAVAPAPFLAPISQSFTDSLKSNSAIGGFQAGYNWQSPSNWIVGIEADFQAVGGGGTGTSQATTGGFFFPPVLTSEVQTVSHTDTLKWLGTVRGRLGYPILPSIMIYGTGGLAYGRVNDSTTASFTGTETFIGPPFVTSASSVFNASQTKVGWTLGGGISGAVPNTPVTWKVEYLYVDLGTANYSFNDPNFAVAISSRLTDDIVRGGFDLHY